MAATFSKSGRFINVPSMNSSISLDLFAHIQKIDFTESIAKSGKYLVRVYRENKVAEYTEPIELEEAKSLIALLTKLGSELYSTLERMEDGIYHFVDGKYSKIDSYPDLLVLPNKKNILKSMVQIPHVPVIITLKELLEFKRSAVRSDNAFTLTIGNYLYTSVKFFSFEEANEAMLYVVEQISYTINEVQSKIEMEKSQ